MSYLFRTTLIGLFFGTFGTTLGGIIGVCLKSTSNKFLSFILSFASGLMLSIVCFDLIPESMEITSISNTVIGVIVGVICMMICDIVVNRKFNINTESTKGNLLKTGIIVSIGLAIHNFPEGLAIGSGFEASITLGYSLALAICLHDIPESIFQMLHYMLNKQFEFTRKYIIKYLKDLSKKGQVLFAIYINRICKLQTFYTIVLSRISLKNNVYDLSSYRYWVRANLLLRCLLYKM